ncbi:MAG: hypothetical protein ACREQX_14230 [Candidatus Binataceae bacterium]
MQSVLIELPAKLRVRNQVVLEVAELARSHSGGAWYERDGGDFECGVAADASTLLAR